jgi:Spy/CpxP family protein refolding chaperone
MIRTHARWLMPVVLGALALAPATYAVAADPPAAQAPAQRQHRDWLKDRLGLSDDQAQQVRAIRRQEMQNARQVHQALRQARAELNRLVLDGADDATIQAKAAEVQQLMGQELALRVDTLKKIAPILTPEQRQKLAELATHGPRHHRHPRS